MGQDIVGTRRGLSRNCLARDANYKHSYLSFFVVYIIAEIERATRRERGANYGIFRWLRRETANHRKFLGSGQIEVKISILLVATFQTPSPFCLVVFVSDYIGGCPKKK